ncbi:MAG: hypothetical protein JRN44_00190 [Nitrososphaerota archaeon]|nr:hypothetical protein [Nitrososphaerota archaeon]MDG6941902.1 hypothetical protein [Nitrososphaerota archaeon]MDG6946925.1 hypothetical protein [Nitrososphaerota archaeon]
MARLPLKLLAVDVVLVALAYLVVRDQAVRADYAASLHTACASLCSYTPSFSYGILVQYFTMTGNGVSLTSPPTLDWFQVIAVLLVVVNAWHLYSNYVKGGQARNAGSSAPHP